MVSSKDQSIVSSPSVRKISSSMVVPSPRPCRRYDLTPWDLCVLSCHYNQCGFLFSNDGLTMTIDQVIQCLKLSLSTTIGCFYPAAGRLGKEISLDECGNVCGMSIFIDGNGQGADFIHAIANTITVNQVADRNVPSFVSLFFALKGAVNYDGISMPLVAVQLTELLDGFFVACSYNHVFGDGTSFCRFLHTWADITRTGESVNVMHAQHDDDTEVYNRCFINCRSPLVLPYIDENQFIHRFCGSEYIERVFHFTSQSIAALKYTVNKERQVTSTISSFQSVASLVWRSITRARRLPDNMTIVCALPMNCRSRLQPPLSPDYVGNSGCNIFATTTVDKLLSKGVSFGAGLLHEAIVSQTDNKIRNELQEWEESPLIFKLANNMQLVAFGMCPRFDFYKCDFGFGKAIAVRGGNANKFSGKITLYAGKEGVGSMDLEINLEPEFMNHLESDKEFMCYAS